MIADILIPLIAVGLAELGDKTQLSICLLSSKTRDHLPLLFGVMLAFLVVDGAAVLVGSWATNILPIDLLRTASGIIFIIFGLLTLRNNEKEGGSKPYFDNPFLSGFALVFITEWGDKTQIASGLLATKYDPLMVLIGTMTALTPLAIIAIYLGKHISNVGDRKTVTKLVGILFMLMGVFFLLF